MMSAEMETEIGPNNNAELYRTAQIVSNPIIDHKHLQFINVSNGKNREVSKYLQYYYRFLKSFLRTN